MCHGARGAVRAAHDTLVPMTFRDASFEGLGGRQTLRVLEAASADAPLVAVAPALGLRASWYEDLARALVARGVHAALVEWPGQGTSPVRPSRRFDWGYAELLEHLASARETARATLSRSSSFAWLGHSIGGTVGLMDAGRSRAVDHVLLVASGTPYMGSWTGKTARQLHLATYLFPFAARVLGYHDGRLGFGGQEARTLMTQWAHLTRTGVWDVPGCDIEGHLRACETSVLAVRIEGDDYAPERAVEHLLGKVPAARIERAVWSGPEPKTAHIRWPRTPEHAAELASRFVSRRG